VPEHSPPDHPVNVEPDAGVAVSTTWVPSSNWAVHVLPQLIPLGELVTVPEPDPLSVTDNARTRSVVADASLESGEDPPAPVACTT